MSNFQRTLYWNFIFIWLVSLTWNSKFRWQSSLKIISKWLNTPVTQRLDLSVWYFVVLISDRMFFSTVTFFCVSHVPAPVAHRVVIVLVSCRHQCPFPCFFMFCWLLFDRQQSFKLQPALAGRGGRHRQEASGSLSSCGDTELPSWTQAPCSFLFVLEHSGN